MSECHILVPTDFVSQTLGGSLDAARARRDGSACETLRPCCDRAPDAGRPVQPLLRRTYRWPATVYARTPHVALQLSRALIRSDRCKCSTYGRFTRAVPCPCPSFLAAPRTGRGTGAGTVLRQPLKPPGGFVQRDVRWLRAGVVGCYVVSCWVSSPLLTNNQQRNNLTTFDGGTVRSTRWAKPPPGCDHGARRGQMSCFRRLPFKRFHSMQTESGVRGSNPTEPKTRGGEQ